MCPNDAALLLGQTGPIKIVTQASERFPALHHANEPGCAVALCCGELAT